MDGELAKLAECVMDVVLVRRTAPDDEGLFWLYLGMTHAASTLARAP